MIDKLMGKRVLVTGASGFFGSHIYRIFERYGFEVYKSYNDLTNEKWAWLDVVRTQPTYIVHCAAKSGGIVWNQTNPDEIFAENTQMTLNLLKAAAEVDSVKVVVSIISSCAYPDTNEDLNEDMFWNGLPNESIRFFGLQKRNIAAYSMALAKQHPEKTFIWPVVNNLYGPGDSYDLVKTKVVGALIKKFYTAKVNGDKSVVCLGTGTPTRQFTYVEDAAQAIYYITHCYRDSFSPINVTTPEETSIKELAEKIALLVGYRGDIIWDTTASDGQMRKTMLGHKLKLNCPIIQWTGLEVGLTKTIRDYEERYV